MFLRMESSAVPTNDDIIQEGVAPTLGTISVNKNMPTSSGMSSNKDTQSVSSVKEASKKEEAAFDPSHSKYNPLEDALWQRGQK